MPFETIEFQRLREAQTNQDAIALTVQREVFVIVDHGDEVSLGLERFETVGETLLARPCSVIIALGGLRDSIDLLADDLAQTCGLGMNFDRRGVTWPECCRLLGFTAHDLGILGAQRGHGLRLNGLAEGSDVGPGTLQALNLLEARPRFRSLPPSRRPERNLKKHQCLVRRH